MKSRRAQRSRPTGGKSPAGCRWHVALPRGISPERGLLVRSGGVEHGAAHAPALRLAGLEARVPGGGARGWAFLRSADFQSAAGAGREVRRMRVPFGLRAWKPAFPGAVLAAGHFLERGLSVRSGGVEHGAAHAPALRLAGLEARVPGGRARGWAFPGARTFSPQRRRRAWRGPCTCPSACGLGSPRSRGRCSRLGISWSADFQSAAGAGREVRRMRVPIGLAGLEARGPGEIPTGRMPVAPCRRLSMRGAQAPHSLSALIRPPGRTLSGPSLRSGLCRSTPFCFLLSVLNFPIPAGRCGCPCAQAPHSIQNSTFTIQNWAAQRPLRRAAAATAPGRPTPRYPRVA